MFLQRLLFLLTFFFLATSISSAEQKKLTLGYISTENPPLAYSENSEDKGILIDIASEIGKRSGVVFQIQKRDWKLLGNEILEGKSDAAIAGIYQSEKRDGNFVYSDSFLNDKVINSYRAKGLKRKNLEGAGDPVTGLLASGYNLIEKTFSDDYNADCENVESGKVQFKDLHGNPPIDPCGRNKSYIGLNILRSGYFSHIFHKGVRDIDFSLVLQKKHENLLPAINKAIAEIKQDGTIDKLFEGYLVKKKKEGMSDGK